jgi:phosphoserine phosphatase
MKNANYSFHEQSKIHSSFFILYFLFFIHHFSFFIFLFFIHHFQLMAKEEQILIRITGQDRPGLTANVMAILSAYNAQILDIGQADIHSTLSLGILIRINERNSGQVMKELLFKATELGVNIGFAPVGDQEYEDWVGRQGKNRYILTMLGRQLSAMQIAAATKVIAEQGLNIDSIRRLTGRPSIMNTKKNVRACIEFSVRGNPRDQHEMQGELMHLSSQMEVDFSFQQDNMFRRMRRLICFDMDSTLIQTEVIDELAMRAGVGDKVKAITERAMRGEIDFKESFTERVALLKGLDVSVMRDIAESLPITEGADRLMYVLKRYGLKIAILSGGFTYFGEYLQKRWGIDYVYANELEIDEDGKLTGNYVGDIVDGKRKAELLRLIAQVEKVDIAQTIAVGDGANDLPMLGEAGLGIAFHAKPRVVANAQQSINTIGLDGVLYFLGFKDSYLDEKGRSTN